MAVFTWSEHRTQRIGLLGRTNNGKERPEATQSWLSDSSK